MTYLTLIITLPLTLFCVLFALSNMNDVQVSFWPLSWQETLPLYVVGLGLMAAGFVCGALFVWLGAQKTRLQLWKETRKSERLEKELRLRETSVDKTPVQITSSVPS